MSTTGGATERHRALRLALFNHKGGVGKTTLTIDIAIAISEMGKRVLLVDSDPQCNLTSHLIPADVVDDLLNKSDTESGRTVWSALKPIVEATGKVGYVEPFERRENVFLVPGDIRLSVFEADLNELWAQCYQRKPKGFRGTTSLSALVNDIATRLDVDVVFYDSGPNIGALNRVVILDCDYFVIPAACDQFSVRALSTVGRTLVSWIREWRTIAELAPAATYLLPGQPRFLGYIPQRFRVYAQKLTADHSEYETLLEKHVRSDIISTLREIDPQLAAGPLQDFMLGQVKDFGTTVSAAQRDGVPIAEKNADAKEIFAALATKILHRLDILQAS